MLLRALSYIGILLKDYGGSIYLGHNWAESFLLRHGYVKCKASKAARKLPPDFANIKLQFLQRIKDEVATNSMPPALILKFDQTNSKLVPVSE